MPSKVQTWKIFGPERDPQGVGFRGVVRGKSNNKLLPNQCPDMYNYLSDGGPVKRGGNAPDNAVELVSDTGITGIFHFYDGSKNRIFAKCGTSVFDVQATGESSTILTDLAVSDEIQFASWFGQYFLTDGINVYYGTTAEASALTFQDENGSSISGVHPHGKSILVKGERLWLTRDPNYPTRVYFSQIDSYQKFNCNGGSDVAAWIACDRDDGKAITGFVEHNGKIFVTKKMKSYWIVGEPTDFDSGTLNRSDALPYGCYDQKTLVDCGDGYLRWYGPEGVYQYSDATGFQHISENIDDELLKIVESVRTKACAGYYDHYYLLMLPGGISEYCDGFAFDTKINEWFPIKNWNIACMCNFSDNTLHAGFYDKGYTAQLFKGMTDNSGAEDVSCYLKTRIEEPPGYPGKKYEHCLDKLQMFNIQNGQSFNLYWNANEGAASGSWPFVFSGVGAYLGEFQLGDSGITDDGDLLIGKDEIGITANPSSRPPNQGGQRFCDIYFEVMESGPTQHSFSCLEISSYLIGEVR